jgi:dihydrofolate reductase
MATENETTLIAAEKVERWCRQKRLNHQHPAGDEGAVGQIRLLEPLPDLGRTRFHHLVEQSLVIRLRVRFHRVGPTPPQQKTNGDCLRIPPSTEAVSHDACRLPVSRAPGRVINRPATQGGEVQELVVDFITSLDGYASAEGWPGWWGLEAPEYLAWLDERPDRDNTILMGANTYRLMYGFAAESEASESGERTNEDDAMAELTRSPKVVFSSTLEDPLAWANTQLIRQDPVEAVGAMKREGTGMSTLGSLTLCRSLLEAGLVDRFRVVMFPVITGKTGRERIYDGYPDVALEMVASRTFDDSIHLVEYVPTVLTGPPDAQPAS